MGIKNRLLLLLIIHFLSCSSKSKLGIGFTTDFNDDHIELFYNNKIILDTCIITDASIGMAKSLYLKKVNDGILTVIVNKSISKSIKTDKCVCNVYIILDSFELRMIKDSVCKKRVYY